VSGAQCLQGASRFPFQDPGVVSDFHPSREGLEVWDQSIHLHKVHAIHPVDQRQVKIYGRLQRLEATPRQPLLRGKRLRCTSSMCAVEICSAYGCYQNVNGEVDTQVNWNTDYFSCDISGPSVLMRLMYRVCSSGRSRVPFLDFFSYI
jgi:hypothetical protein